MRDELLITPYDPQPARIWSQQTSTATIQLAGHKSVDSLSHYAVATKRQRKEMAMIATGQASEQSIALAQHQKRQRVEDQTAKEKKAEEEEAVAACTSLQS